MIMCKLDINNNNIIEKKNFNMEAYMNTLIQKNIIGASMVFIINHSLTYLGIFLGLKIAVESESLTEGTLFGMLFNIPAYSIFIIINIISFNLIRKRLQEWSLWMNTLILFILSNLVLGRFNEVDYFYWIRYGIALSFLLFINAIVKKFPVSIKIVIGLIPILLTILFLVLHGNYMI